MKDIVYLDHNSTTPLHDEVLSKMQDFMHLPLNSSAQHHYGQYAQSLINQAKKDILSSINANNYDIIFTATATEATNTIFFGGNFEDIIFSNIEHASVYNCRPNFSKITEVNCFENGLIDLEDFSKKIANKKNFLTSIMACNNETGAIQPIEEIAKITHQNLGLCHTDLVQALGKIPLDLEKLNIDFASISAHKINGPQGIGALIFRKNLDFKPLIFGGKQQQSKRAGSLNIIGIIGFAKACIIANQHLQDFAKIAILRDYLEKNLLEIAKDNILIFAKNTQRLSNTCFYSLKNCSNQTQLINFDLNNICVSAGASCSSGSINSSRILKSMNVTKDFIDGAIRVSLGLSTTKEDVDYFLKIFSQFYSHNFKH